MIKDPVEIFAKIKDYEKVSFLHSNIEGKSFLGTECSAEITSESLEELREFSKKHKDKLLIGFISYDTCYQNLKLEQTATDDLHMPKVHFKAYEKWDEFEYKAKNPPKKISSEISEFKSNTSKKEYKEAYKKIKKYIKEGDIYQANLTHRLELKTKLSGAEIFINAVKSNPVNYMAYIETGDFEIISASPERFIKIQEGTITTYPIKGTRPRGKSKVEDKRLKTELIESEKEAAELNMITDLLRNDLGKVSKSGTVKVKGHRIIQECSNVWHTYSEISGELKVDNIEALISMLPGGSITGCPKKRAVEIIDELEPNTRGLYTGVIGYMHPNRSLDFNIAIRTIIKKKEKAYLQVGGGIVLDSSEEEEYMETLNKAKSLINCI